VALVVRKTGCWGDVQSDRTIFGIPSLTTVPSVGTDVPRRCVDRRRVNGEGELCAGVSWSDDAYKAAIADGIVILTDGRVRAWT